MRIEVKKEWAEKFDEAMSELGIEGVFNLDHSYKDFYTIGSRIPQRIGEYHLNISIAIPDDWIEVIQ